jgi:hypothetical protein
MFPASWILAQERFGLFFAGTLIFAEVPTAAGEPLAPGQPDQRPSPFDASVTSGPRCAPSRAGSDRATCWGLCGHS